jgi:hypothetical protein
LYSNGELPFSKIINIGKNNFRNKVFIKRINSKIDL